MARRVKKLADRYNGGKLQWGLVHWKSLEPLVKVLMYGQQKYDSWNWAKGLSYTALTESLLRHTFSFLHGEDDDPESKISHVGHILANSMFLSYMFLFRKDLDDRHKENGNKTKKN